VSDGQPSAGRRLIGQILKDQGVVREGQVQEGLREQQRHGGLLGQCLVALGHCTQQQVVMALAEQAGMESVDLSSASPQAEALELVDSSTAHAYGILPLRLQGDVLTVALADPMNTAVLQDLGFSTGKEVRGAVAAADEIKAKVLEHYGAEVSVADAIAAAAAAVSKADPEFEAPPPHLALPLVSRIKVMSNLDITETRVPQDGRIELTIDGRPVDLRVATLPGVSGEGCVMRILDRSSVNLELAALGLRSEDESVLRKLTELPHGIVLVTGPTGSGKTTSLYAMLQEANRPEVKIITAEDPVEYDIEGIVQVPVNPDIDVTYAAVLRSVLRQDPDKILIGEIRDQETAAVAVEASLTGHTVFSTVHTNDAPSTVTRLVDMGIAPFLISATLEAVVAQRLVRNICPDCRASFEPDDELLLEFGQEAERLRGATFYFGKGCPTCHHTGHKGRTAIFEILIVDEKIRKGILDGKSSGDLRELALRSGMQTLRESGIQAVLEGRTTIEEVLRETSL
jgi:type IV pilus assembly protein PilB